MPLRLKKTTNVRPVSEVSLNEDLDNQYMKLSLGLPGEPKKVYMPEPWATCREKLLTQREKSPRERVCWSQQS